jgi:predicted permease
MTRCPPRLAVWLLTSRVPADWRDFVLGDLEEEFRLRSRQSPAAARRWFWRQTIRCVARPPRAHARVDRPRERRLGDSMIRSFVADLRYGTRVLRRQPGFSLAVALVLALGIGANAAIFSIFNTVLLRPLPFERPETLVRLFHTPPPSTFPGIPRFPVSPANFYDWQREATSFDRMAIYRFRQFTLTGDGPAASTIAVAVGAGFFDIVGTPPLIGRTFRDDEDAPGKRVAIVSEGFWRTTLGARADVIGRTLRLSGEAYEIVGVMPARFSARAWGASGRDVWVPLGYTADERHVRENHNAQVVARLKPEVALAEADAELRAISERLEQQYPKENAGWGATAITLHELIVGDSRASLVTLLVAVGLVLLIACANVGNLLFARALARHKELAVRSALGAGRRRVFQQILAEVLVLAIIGGGIGLLLAHLGLSVGAALLADQVPRADELAIDGWVLAFTLLTSVVAAVLAGALPALRAGRAPLTEALKEGGRSDGAVGLRTRRLLITAEVALSVILLMGAAVTMRSLAALRTIDAGFNPANVFTMRLSLPKTKYDTPEKSRAFMTIAAQRLAALPGVEAVSAIDDLPTQAGSVQPVVVAGRPELLPSEQPTTEVRLVLPGYPRAMRIPLLRGRDVSHNDVDAVLVSESAARLLWKDDDPIGQRIILPLESRDITREVVGIVGDVRQGELSDGPSPTLYQFARQRDWSNLVLVLRTAVPPLTIAQPAAAVIRALDPEQPIDQAMTMQDVMDTTLTSERLNATLLGLFAALALILASVGIYSVLSNIVRGRSREISIRAALGARTSDVLRLVVREGMTPAIVGIAIGSAGAVASAQLLDAMLFGISARDPLTLAAVAATLSAVALVASLVPAYRASRVDPLRALR